MDLFICTYSKCFIKGLLSVRYRGVAWYILVNKTDIVLDSHKLIKKVDGKQIFNQIGINLQTVI